MAETGSEKCTSCGLSVSARERAFVKKLRYHKACLRCTQCNVPLQTYNVFVFGTDMMCKVHYDQAVVGKVRLQNIIKKQQELESKYVEKGEESTKAEPNPDDSESDSDSDTEEVKEEKEKVQEEQKVQPQATPVAAPAPAPAPAPVPQQGAWAVSVARPEAGSALAIAKLQQELNAARRSNSELQKRNATLMQERDELHEKLKAVTHELRLRTEELEESRALVAALEAAQAGPSAEEKEAEERALREAEEALAARILEAQIKAEEAARLAAEEAAAAQKAQEEMQAASLALAEAEAHLPPSVAGLTSPKLFADNGPPPISFFSPPPPIDTQGPPTLDKVASPISPSASLASPSGSPPDMSQPASPPLSPTSAPLSLSEMAEFQRSNSIKSPKAEEKEKEGFFSGLLRTASMTRRESPSLSVTASPNHSITRRKSQTEMNISALANAADASINGPSAPATPELRPRTTSMAVQRTKEIESARLRLPELEGFIHKKSPAQFVGYQKRYVVVKDYNLYYSADVITIDNTTISSNSNIHCLSLVVVNSITPGKKAVNFEISARDPDDGKLRCYKFKCDDAAERDRWVRGLNEHRNHLMTMLEWASQNENVDLLNL